MNTYLTLRDRHIGEVCFIYGAGPSLRFCSTDDRFPWLGTYGVQIAVNSSVIECDNFDYWISNDSLCRRWSWWKNVKQGIGTKIVRNSWEPYKEELDGFLFFEPRESDEEIKEDENKLVSCSSVPTSLDLAMQMGCKKIFILGLDHNNYEGKDHFWKFYPKHIWPKANPPAQGPWKQQQSIFSNNIKAYKALKEYAEERYIQIYNLNYMINGQYITKVDIFNKIQMKDLEGLVENTTS
ncbi:MAG: hypothetical protein J7L15_00710 [Clostridiales bacterium]|nr:hypothetical protein [Clostridiales bacterium]